jgi:hypothetical protein
MVIRTALVASVVLLAATAAEARVTRIEITKREAFVAGHVFGSVGPYEKVVGRVHGELDPGHPLNASIVDLDRAPRNHRGAVEYSADFYILKPVDLSKGNGALLYDVNNRGDKYVLRKLNSTLERVKDPTTLEHAGDGFLMRHGFTVVWSGWMQTPPRDNTMRVDVPSASGLEETVWDEFFFNTKGQTEGRLTFRATSTDTTRATLTVREGTDGAPTALTQWEFADDRTIRLLPAGTPFRMGVLYQLVYRAANPPVAGIGFAATRDVVAFLRREAQDAAGTMNPLASAGGSAIRRTLAHGTSQSGRYLRDFIHRGFNEDEGGRMVFDGVNPHVAAARLFLNYRFAQPDGAGRGSYPDSAFPFAYDTQTDSLTGRTDGILARCTLRRTCPKIIDTASSNEYWGSGRSLVTTDTVGRRDTTPPETVRIYLLASTQHVIRQTMPKGVCGAPYNSVDHRPALRALTLALDRWVADGTAPPPSRYPRIADGSLVTMESLGFPRLPGIELLAGPYPKPRVDYGPAFAKGIIGRVPPQVLSEAYAVLVPKVDADGNELAGIRLPDIAVPTGTATGWAVRTAEAGARGALCGLDGFFLPFSRTKAEREAIGDPRQSLQERYRDKADYVAKVQAAAAALERQGYLLGEDVQRINERAATVSW